jgi:predicted transcriptional regulator
MIESTDLMNQPDEPSDVERWQVDEIIRGLVEADNGNFASDEEVAQAIKRWSEKPLR